MVLFDSGDPFATLNRPDEDEDPLDADIHRMYDHYAGQGQGGGDPGFHRVPEGMGDPSFAGMDDPGFHNVPSGLGDPSFAGMGDPGFHRLPPGLGGAGPDFSGVQSIIDQVAQSQATQLSPHSGTPAPARSPYDAISDPRDAGVVPPPFRPPPAASDGQTLAQQTAWTQQAFRAAYGANAEGEWVRQHEQQLEQNRRLYGTPEPQAGQRPLPTAPAMAPSAPNRTIGAVAPPQAGPIPNTRGTVGQPTMPTQPQAPAQPTPRQLADDAKRQAEARLLPEVATPLGRVVNDDPLSAVAKVTIPGSADPYGRVNPNSLEALAYTLSRNVQGSDQFLNAAAQLAWYRQEVAAGRRPPAPEAAPGTYIESWKGAWRAGQDVPLAAELRQAIAAQGHRPVTPGTPGRPSPEQVDQAQPGGQTDWQKRWGENLAPDQFRAHSETGELTREEALAACGPAAAIAFARANGRNPTMREAVEMAKQVGWTPGAGMAGPESQVALLQKMGVQASLDPRVDFAKVDAAIARGVPVIFDTQGSRTIPSGHYFTVYGKRGDQYLVGGSGTGLKGGASWMTVEQMTALAGAPRSAIYMDPASMAQAATDRPQRFEPERNIVPMEGLDGGTGTIRRFAAEETLPMGSGRERLPVSSAMPGDLGALAVRAEAENPWSSDQPARWEALARFHALPGEERQRVFEDSLDMALAAEGIPPEQRDYWKQNMRAVVLGDGRFPGENPGLNPFAMAGEGRGNGLYASDASDKSPRSNELNSSALGYYQFIIHDPRDPNRDPYGHRAHIPEGENFYDPVTQHRMFIRAIRSSAKHRGDPASVVREKAATKVWGP
jgi:hypothetical protein